MMDTSDTKPLIASSTSAPPSSSSAVTATSATGSTIATPHTLSTPKLNIAISTLPKRTIPPAQGSHTSTTSSIHPNSATFLSVAASSCRIDPPLSHQPQSLPSSPKSSSLSSSPKKKKQVISMATAQSATATAAGENTGRWTGEEHRLFLQGLEQHGKGWKKIASLIKSRTVVQIRTHAQKYFQKLSKARQNGDDGDVSMENHRGDRFVVSGNGSSGVKKRKSGTKRKAISSVVASVERESKRAMSDKKTTARHSAALRLPVISPVLAPYVFSVDQGNDSDGLHDTDDMEQGISAFPSITTSNGTISGSALEDSLFRFLSPMAVEPPTGSPTEKVNEVARQAGANPIIVPSSDALKSSQAQSGGIVSPTGVNDFPQNWVWEADPPSWFSRGADVDELLDEADALDWLTDTGDLTEAYFPPPEHAAHNLNTFSEPSLLSLVDSDVNADARKSGFPAPIPVLESNMDITANSTSMQNIPALFESANNLLNSMKKVKSINLSSNSLFASATEAADAVTDDVQFHLFDAHLDEQAFVTALLDHNSDSQNTLNHLNQQ